MTESDPFEHAREKPQFKTVELRGPNVTSSIDRPLRADALRVQQAAIRKHLHEREPRDQSGGGA
ncbi:MAG TPA: hypothetical protein VGI76_05235 [Solirubrobacteraceae bacterium]|jgi:hypothetical protein